MTAEVFPGTGLFARAAAAFAASVPADPADDGLFGPGSVTWRLHADLSAPVSGLRALLLQALHPLAMAGVNQHSQWREDPGGRFASTSAYVLTTTYGERATAQAAALRVRKIHQWVRGTDPVTGQPYQAGDPALLLWVHAGLVDSGLAAARRFGLRLTPAEQDQYVAEMTAVAELIGMPAGLAPASVADLDGYFTAVRPELATSPAMAEAIGYLLAMPDVEQELGDIWQVVVAAAVSSLPGWARDLHGFGAGGPQPGTAAPSRDEVRQVLGLLDAIYLGEPGVLEARQRLTLRMRAAQETGRARAQA
jgi:uncharacterized protein (DUF2236 family)